MVDASIIKADAARLRESYDAVIGQIDRTWRRAAIEPNPRRRAALETKAHDLQYRARVLAGTHERAQAALKALGDE